jgi:hypothetical protein
MGIAAVRCADHAMKMDDDRGLSFDRSLDIRRNNGSVARELYEVNMSRHEPGRALKIAE